MSVSLNGTQRKPHSTDYPLFRFQFVQSVAEFSNLELLLEADRHECVRLDFCGIDGIRMAGGVSVLFCAIHQVVERIRPVVTEPPPEVLPVVDPLVEELSIDWIRLSHIVVSGVY